VPIENYWLISTVSVQNFASKLGDNMSLIIAKNLSKTYINGEIAVDALKELNFEIEHSSFISFIGPSGSGKTTLLNLIGCLDKPTTGMLKVSDTDVSNLDKKSSANFRGQNIGFVFQDFNLIPVLTVYENVEYPLLMVQYTTATERQKRVLDLLDSVGMLEQKNKYPDQISGGQKQRVAIARALITNPRLVLADEPTANLDHETAYMVINIMKKIMRESGTTFIFSTHDQKVVREVETIYTLEDGVLIGKKNQGDKDHV
jgi:putative ABC transport system ATP-binding protein